MTITTDDVRAAVAPIATRSARRPPRAPGPPPPRAGRLRRVARRRGAAAHRAGVRGRRLDRPRARAGRCSTSIATSPAPIRRSRSVSSMHPAVISYWLLPASSDGSFVTQRDAVCASAMAGEQWGTITSEPGSGGDILKTKAVATPLDGQTFLPGAGFGITGDKHFGSGSGICDRMLTTGVVQGDDKPSVFVLDTHDRPWDGTAGYELLGEWDGMGMAATQSHAMRLARRARGADGLAGRARRGDARRGAVHLHAVHRGGARRAGRGGRARPHPARREGRRPPGLRAGRVVARRDGALARGAGVRGRACAPWKPATRPAPCTTRSGPSRASRSWPSRCCNASPGSLAAARYSQRSPFARWYEDVRALGFLRPPWGLAYDTLFNTSFA